MTIHNEKQLLKQVDELALMLDGELSSLSTSNSSGRTSDKIIIAEDRIKELQLLIEHWRKQNETNTKSN